MLSLSLIHRSSLFLFLYFAYHSSFSTLLFSVLKIQTYTGRIHKEFMALKEGGREGDWLSGRPSWQQSCGFGIFRDREREREVNLKLNCSCSNHILPAEVRMRLKKQSLATAQDSSLFSSSRSVGKNHTIVIIDRTPTDHVKIKLKQCFITTQNINSWGQTQTCDTD